jgi:hypothetical protein
MLATAAPSRVPSPLPFAAQPRLPAVGDHRLVPAAARLLHKPHPARETGQRGDVGSHLRPHFVVDLARITLCATAAAASELPARQADADGGDLAVNSVVLPHLQRPIGSAVTRVSTSGERLRARQSALGTAQRRRSSPRRDQRAWTVGSRMSTMLCNHTHRRGTDPLRDLRRILAGRWSARRRRPQRTGINPDAGTAAISWSVGPSARGFDGRRMRSRQDARCGRRSGQRVSRGRSPAVYESRY